MPYGIQIWGIDGLITIDNDVRIPLVVQKTVITAAATSGTFSIPSNVAAADAFFVVDYPNVVISLSGTTVTWSGVSVGTTFTVTVLEF